MSSTVYLSDEVLHPFLEVATTAYLACTPEKPPSCFAVLVGHDVANAVTVARVEFGRNVRACDAMARTEFSEEVVPRFGVAYDNPYRGYWCDSADLLRIARSAEQSGMDIVGSVHLHPDWHLIGPAHERGLRISEAPTPMDSYMFANTFWPVNVICYLEHHGSDLYFTLAAWGQTERWDIRTKLDPLTYLAG